MGSNLSAAQRDDLARRRAERAPIYWMQLTEAEAQALAVGRIPDLVQSMAQWLCEPIEATLARHTAAQQTERRRRR